MHRLLRASPTAQPHLSPGKHSLNEAPAPHRPLTHKGVMGCTPSPAAGIRGGGCYPRNMRQVGYIPLPLKFLFGGLWVPLPWVTVHENHAHITILLVIS